VVGSTGDRKTSAIRRAEDIRSARVSTRLERAIGFDEEAALNSASWGADQVMGFNHPVAGFTTVKALVDAMVRALLSEP